MFERINDQNLIEI